MRYPHCQAKISRLSRHVSGHSGRCPHCEGAVRLRMNLPRAMLLLCVGPLFIALFGPQLRSLGLSIHLVNGCLCGLGILFSFDLKIREG